MEEREAKRNRMIRKKTVEAWMDVIVYAVLKVYPSKKGPVAQLVRASPCHGEGRGFESLLGRYN